MARHALLRPAPLSIVFLSSAAVALVAIGRTDAPSRFVGAVAFAGEHGFVTAWVALGATMLALSFASMARERRARMSSERSDRANAERYRAASERSADGFFMLEAIRDGDGRIVDFALADVNDRGSELLGRIRTGLVGAHLSELLSAHRSAALIARYGQVLDSGEALVEETRADVIERDATWLWHQAVPVEGGVAVTTRDIGERKRTEDALRLTALTDELTGLKNRRGFVALGEHQLKVARRNGCDAVVLYADLDGFKRINDTFGHAEGDRALREIADVLRSALRDTDVIARLGGDEFTVLLVGGDRATADTVVERVRVMLETRNAAPGRAYPLAISFGVARLDHDREMSLDDLLGAADLSLYATKRRRKQQAA